MLGLPILLAIAGAISIAIAVLLLLYAKKKAAHAETLLRESRDQWKNAKQEIEAEKRESLLKVKDEIYKKRSEFELEKKRDRVELERLQSKLNAKYEVIEKKEQGLDSLRLELQQKERELLRGEDLLRANEAKIKTMYSDLISKLERVSNMSRDEAKQTLLHTLEAEVAMANQKWVQKVEEDTKHHAKDKATHILVTAMQRYTSEQVTQHSSSVVHLPNEEMKGRIIGKEGRNIKSLETATGMEFVIGETPEIITISGFNPVRREVARRTLERLITDGRINPTRIEETVERVEKEIEEIIEEYGKEVTLEFNLQGIKQEIITLLGKLHFRTSFSQNVLVHCKEVGIFARMSGGR